MFESIIYNIVDSVINLFKPISYHQYSSLLYDTICSISLSSELYGKNKSETQNRAKIHERSLMECLKKNTKCVEIERKGRTDWWYVKKNGYNNTTRFDIKDLKKAIKEKKLECKNTTPLKDGIYIFHQPRGSQSHPDCLLVRVIGDHMKLFPIECKSFTTKIMWNDSYPIPYYFYYATNKQSCKSVLFQGGVGEGVLTQQEYALLQENERLVKSIRKKISKMCSKLSSKERRNGWGAYPRFNFTQNPNKKNGVICDVTLVSPEIKQQWKNKFCTRMVEFLS